MAARRRKLAQRHRASDSGPRRREAPPKPWIPATLACTIGLILVIPCLRFTWLWDDFDFVGRAQVFRPVFLLPDPRAVYYRPISRELFFAAIWGLGRASPMVAHAASAALFAASIWLLFTIATRLAGPRVGAYTGIAFASLGAAPLLVGWASGVQDLMAVVFGLLALLLAIDGRALGSVCAVGAAMLSKETALAMAPVAAAVPWIIGRRPARPLMHLLPSMVLVAAWATVHPALGVLGRHESALQNSQYVGFAPPGRATFAVSTLLSLVNLPPPGVTTSALADRPMAGVMAAAVSLGLLWVVGRQRAQSNAVRVSARGITFLGGLLALLPFLLTVVLFRRWAPYYSVIPAIGSSLLIGLALARIPGRFAAVAPVILIVFLAAGVWTRGMRPDSSVPCERNLEATSQALLRVERGFLRLNPSLPPHTTALISVVSTGSLGINTHMHRFQALRVWYGDPTIVALQPEKRRPGNTNERLFRVTDDLGVVEIGTRQFEFRSSGLAPPTAEVQRPARTYVRSVAAGGDPLRAFQYQLEIARLDRGAMNVYDLRLAAMYLYLAGRPSDASRMLDTIPSFSRALSLDMVTKLYEEPTQGYVAEQYAFRAFSLSEDDLEANRCIMRRLWKEGYYESAVYFARRVQQLAPGDAEAAGMIRRARMIKPRDELTVPVGINSL